LIYIFYIQSKIPAEVKAPEKPVTTTAVAPEIKKPSENFWKAPDIASLETNPDKDEILYGKNLVAHTSEYFGIKGSVRKNSTNGMNCQNCHLDAGTRVFGNNYGSVFSTYPRYRARSGGIENIYKRVNDCFERSLNGEPLDTNSREMQAIASYINWLGQNVPKGEKAAGSGLKDMTLLDRPADPKKGKIVYTAKCQSCHMTSGEGQLNGDQTAYIYPPLWGSNSYNTGAGLYRMYTFARYVRYNMPFGATHTNPQLSDEEAWDVAAFINSQPRPDKDIRKDWPKIEEKPFDHPFGPYADGFDEQQHKYGPYQPIKEKLEAMKKK
jgi:thiosulfate dehydrogenase